MWLLQKEKRRKELKENKKSKKEKIIYSVNQI